MGASASITVKLPVIPLWVPAQAQATLRGLVATTIRLALQDIAGRVSDEAGKFADTGNLAQSFGADPATSTGGIEVMAETSNTVLGRVFSSLPYAVVMNDGRRAGAPISRVGIDAIGLWAQRKLGLTTDQAASAKWAIATAIMRRGIPAKHYFDLGVQRAAPRVEQMFTILSDQIGAALVKPGTGATGTGGGPGI